MSARAVSPRAVQGELAMFKRAVMNALAHLELKADQAYQRENAAEARLHNAHVFLHYQLDRAKKPEVVAVLYELAEVLGYPKGAPDRGDIQRWLDADKPTPVCTPPRREKRLCADCFARSSIEDLGEGVMVENAACDNFPHAMEATR